MPAAKLQPSPPSAQVPDELRVELEQILVKHNVPGVSIAIVDGDAQHDVCLGHAETGESASPMRPTHRLQIASLSKTVAAAFLCEYVRANGLSLDATVNSLLQASNAEWTLKSAPGCPAEWAEQVVHTFPRQPLLLQPWCVGGMRRNECRSCSGIWWTIRGWACTTSTECLRHSPSLR